MSLRYTIEQEDSLIRVNTAGLFTFLEAYEMWERIVAACAKHDCYQILGRSNLDEPLPEMDAYEHVGILESVGITGKHRIAWVAVKPVLADKLHVIEKIGTNRHSFDLKVFTEERAALRWLSAGS